MRTLRRGQGLLEFALSISLFLVLVASLFELSWVYYNACSLQNAASKAARAGCLGRTNAEVSGALAPANVVSIAVTTPGGQSVASTDRTTGNTITVTGAMPYHSITPLARLVQYAAPRTLYASASRRIE